MNEIYVYLPVDLRKKWKSRFKERGSGSEFVRKNFKKLLESEKTTRVLLGQKKDLENQIRVINGLIGQKKDQKSDVKNSQKTHETAISDIKDQLIKYYKLVPNLASKLAKEYHKGTLISENQNNRPKQFKDIFQFCKSKSLIWKPLEEVKELQAK